MTVLRHLDREVQEAGDPRAGNAGEKPGLRAETWKPPRAPEVATSRKEGTAVLALGCALGVPGRAVGELTPRTTPQSPPLEVWGWDSGIGVLQNSQRMNWQEKNLLQGDRKEEGPEGA